MEIKREEVEIRVPKSEFVVDGDSRCFKCKELEERSKRAEVKIVELETEIEKKKGEYEALKVEFRELESKKISMEDELKAFRMSNNEVKVVDLTKDGDEDVVTQLLDESAALGCEKKKAESDVEAWKKKFKGLESWISRVDEKTLLRGGKQLLCEVIRAGSSVDAETGIEQLQINNKSLDIGHASSTPGKETSYKDHLSGHTALARKKGVYLQSEGECRRSTRRNLSFEKAERSPNKKMAPSTPAGGKPARLIVVDICDSDDESDTHSVQMPIQNDHDNREVCTSTDHVSAGTLDDKQEMITENCSGRVIGSEEYEDHLDDFVDSTPSALTPKRKRAAKIVSSDSESDDDDVPLSQRKKVHLLESIPRTENVDVNNDIKCPVTRSKRRLATLRQCEETAKGEQSSPNKTGEFNHGRGISTTADLEDSESEDIGSESEGDSLGGFIVQDYSDGSDDSSSQSLEKSDDDADLGGILSRLQRRRDHTLKWELEADMLSAFGKSDELCMRAVCALYRQQTSDEQVSKETMHTNKRGFSKFDARRGSDLARFLTDGDPDGDLKKSLKQLEARGAKAVKLCRDLAARYSKQLFEIYKNKEDPLFLPS